MTTIETVQHYFGSLRDKADWTAFLSDDMVFTSYTSPVKQIAGKAAFVAATKRFYSMIVGVEVREVVVQNGKACVLTSYDLQPPGGPRFKSDVAEILGVHDGKIDSFSIYFDSAPFPK